MVLGWSRPAPAEMGGCGRQTVGSFLFSSTMYVNSLFSIGRTRTTKKKEEGVHGACYWSLGSV